jgi:hypothetical protein
VDSVDDAQWIDQFEKPYENLNFLLYMTLGNHDNSYFGGEGSSNQKGEFQVDYQYKEDRQSDKWKIAFAHHLYLSNGLHGNAGTYDSVLGNGAFYKDLIEKTVCDQVDVIITDHDHDIQWLRPVEACGKTVQVVLGAGAKTRSFTDIDRNPSYFQADETLDFFYIEIEGDESRGTAYLLNTDGEYSIAHQQKRFSVLTRSMSRW